MRAVYNERTCEPGRFYARRWAVGLGSFLLVMATAITAEITSGHGDVDNPTPQKTEDIVPEQAVLSEGVLQNLIYQDRLRTAEYTAQRAQDSGEATDINTCHAAVQQLALVSIGPVTIDCTPSTTTLSTP